MSIHSTGLGDDKVSASGPAKVRGPSGVAAKYAPLSDWFIISGMKRTATYEALGRGNLRAIKFNGRTLMDVEHGLAYMARLPEAKITSGRGKQARAAAR